MSGQMFSWRDALPSNSGWVFYAVIVVAVVALLNFGAVIWLSVDASNDQARKRAEGMRCNERIAPRADLAGCQFSSAAMSRSQLSYADLTGAQMSYASLVGADLSHADLTDADLRSADLTGADLSQAQLTDANLSDATLTGATMDQTRVGGVTWSHTTCPDGALNEAPNPC